MYTFTMVHADLRIIAQLRLVPFGQVQLAHVTRP
jgi:hypothetical protein